MIHNRVIVFVGQEISLLYTITSFNYESLECFYVLVVILYILIETVVRFLKICVKGGNLTQAVM